MRWAVGAWWRACTRRSSPTAAIVTASTSGFTAIATMSPRALMTGEGRPMRPSAAPAVSLTRPKRPSSLVRAPMVERFSPRSAVSVARESGPERCTAVSIRARFARRTSSAVPGAILTGTAYEMRVC